MTDKMNDSIQAIYEPMSLVELNAEAGETQARKWKA